jgi:hypothetical protein
LRPWNAAPRLDADAASRTLPVARHPPNDLFEQAVAANGGCTPPGDVAVTGKVTVEPAFPRRLQERASIFSGVMLVVRVVDHRTGAVPHAATSIVTAKGPSGRLAGASEPFFVVDPLPPP